MIILSRPSEAGNAGAVCRAMKNMGLSRLRLAAPEFNEMPFGAITEAGFSYGGKEAVILARAVHAGDVWENAETFDTLAEAVKDCSFVIGTTRRRGRHRKQVTMTPSELASFLKDHPGKAGIVFGNERTGLEDEELALCNIASHIPVNEAFPSLNLSHAVMVYAYELCLKLPEKEAVKGQWVPMNQEAIETLVQEITGNFKLLGFYKQAGRKEQERFFRDLFSRSGITERDGRYFGDLIARAVRLAMKGDTKQ